MGCQIELDFNGLLIGTTEITIAWTTNNSLMSYSANLYSYGTDPEEKLIDTVMNTNMIIIPKNESTDRYFSINSIDGNSTTSSYFFSFLQGS